MAVTAQAWKNAVGAALPAEEEWAFHGKFAYRRPAEWVALGVLAEGSRQRDEVYLWAVVMPLYLTTEHLLLSWSERVEASGTFTLKDAQRLEEGVRSALDRLPKSEPEALARLAASASEASQGASALLAATEAEPTEVERLRLVRDATAKALGLGG